MPSRYWPLMLLASLALGLAWWLWPESDCGPGEVGRLWFSSDRTLIVGYCDSVGRYVRPRVPLAVPLPDSLPAESTATARLVISELDDTMCPPGVVRERPQTEGFLVYCDAETGEVMHEPMRSQLQALSCGPPSHVKVITAENEVICRPLAPQQ